MEFRKWCSVVFLIVLQGDTESLVRKASSTPGRTCCKNKGKILKAMKICYLIWVFSRVREKIFSPFFF